MPTCAAICVCVLARSECQGHQQLEKATARHSEDIEVIAEQLEPAALEEAQNTAANFTPRPIDAEANGLYQNLPWDRTATTNVAQVRRAQGFLSVLGYGPGPIDGQMGDRTREAIMAFEADQGLPRTGRVDAVLIERLERAAAG